MKILVGTRSESTETQAEVSELHFGDHAVFGFLGSECNLSNAMWSVW